MLDALQIPRSMLKPSPPFFGITLGSLAKPLRHVKLLITFGLPTNIRTEKVLFDVANFRIVYNAIMGRPVMA